MPIFKGGIPTYTWAAKPTAAAFGIGQAFFSDVGVDGSMWYSNGTSWVKNNAVTLQANNKGWIVASLAAANAASYSQSGTTLTVTCTAHTLVALLNGSDIYLAIGTPATGVAPTAPTYTNWFTNFTYVDANTFTCTAGNSQTGTGAINTNTATTEILELSYTVQGGLMGKNGCLVADMTISRSNEASAKTELLFLGGANYHYPTATTSNASYRSGASICNVNSESIQSCPTSLYSGWGTGSGSTALARFGIDTTVSKTHQVKVSVSAALGYIALQQFKLEVS